MKLLSEPCECAASGKGCKATGVLRRDDKNLLISPPPGWFMHYASEAGDDDMHMFLFCSEACALRCLAETSALHDN